MKKALVLGAGGFIGNHLVNQLKREGYWVRAADLKYPEFSSTLADEFVICDLRNYNQCSLLMLAPGQHSLDEKQNAFDEVYQLAADMGGAGYIFSGENDANVMHNSAQINLNVAELCKNFNVKKVFYSSSACIYPAYNQEDPNNPECSESSAYPAAPDSEYGWEKLFSERLYAAYAKNYGLNVRVARFHNIFGPLGTWNGGREKAPAAICRKVLQASDSVEIWGDGNQTRSFLYIDECIRGIRLLMNSDFFGPVNIGSNEMVTINQLVDMACSFENKQLEKIHIDGPLGVRGRNSNNDLIKEKLNWSPDYPLLKGLRETYFWIKEQLVK
jgi:GDP-D-mannose 3',5'-epimerase